MQDHCLMVHSFFPATPDIDTKPDAAEQKDGRHDVGCLVAQNARHPDTRSQAAQAEHQRDNQYDAVEFVHYLFCFNHLLTFGLALT